MQHMNADHKDAHILIAKRFAGVEEQEAEITSVDRLGSSMPAPTVVTSLLSPSRGPTERNTQG